ncbi:MAG: hypothetical protein GY841_20645 [FCB group bacterium]|nr:hypothetical protein [FCB group bacterium]
MIEALQLLTRDKQDSYEKYIDKIARSGNIIAIKVKLADLKDNMDITRLPNELTGKDIDRLIKYLTAFKVLSLYRTKK